MKKYIASLLCCFTFFISAQETEVDSLKLKTEAIVYHKNTDINELKTFKADIKDRYKDKYFAYKEEQATDTKNSSIDLGFLNIFALFMQTVFPFLLGGFIIFLILKAILGFDSKFWKSAEKLKKISTNLLYEDEDLYELHLEELLEQAIENNNFRLAIRYYYLTSLKILSSKEIIEYHKDKTNSEYLFEIENTTIKEEFLYLSYVYYHVWYGEFSVNKASFTVAQHKYQSFLNSLI